MDNLNKENYFNEMTERYPVAMKKFNDWIDGYKKEVNWNIVFNSYSEYQNRFGKNAIAPKFHDLPFDMQKGIIVRFMCETFPNSKDRYNDPETMGNILKNVLRQIDLL